MHFLLVDTSREFLVPSKLANVGTLGLTSRSSFITSRATSRRYLLPIATVGSAFVLHLTRVDGLIDDERWLPFPIVYCGRVMFDAIRFSVGGMVVAIWTLALAI